MHLQRKLGKTINYKARSPNASASESENNKENASPPENQQNNGSRISQLMNRNKEQ